MSAFSVRCVFVDFVDFVVAVVVEDEGFGGDGGVGVLLLIAAVGRGVFGVEEGEGDLLCTSLCRGGDGVGDGFGGEVWGEEGVIGVVCSWDSGVW